MKHRKLLLASLPGWLLAQPLAAAEPVSASVHVSRSEVTLESDSGVELEIETRRVGFEYWERMLGELQAGVELGYSESTRSGSIAGTSSGNYGALLLRYQPRFGEHFALRSEASWGVQDDTSSRDGVEREVRIYETRALLAPELRFGPLSLAAGGSWRRIEYREEEGTAGAVLIDINETAEVSPYAALGLRTDDGGLVRFEYRGEQQSGWRIQFERNF